MSRKQSLKVQVSFNFLLDQIKDTIGISTYIKMLIVEDMEKRNK